MRLSNFCVTRPVFTIVLILLMVIIGFVGFSRLEVRDLPKIDSPSATIVTTFIGADAALIESQITKRIEDELAGVEGIDYIVSSSRDNRSNITITFKEGYDIEIGLNDLRDKLSAVASQLPTDADAPILQKADAEGGGSATMYIGFTDDRRSPLALTDYLEEYVQPELQQIEGVGTADILGAREYSLRIWPNPEHMAARGITVGDIADVLIAQNISVPAGSIKSESRDYTISTNTKLEHVDDFRNLVLRSDRGRIIHLRDVAEVAVDALDDSVTLRANGLPAVGFAITPQSEANPVNVSADVRRFLDSIKPSLPIGMQVNVLYDRATFIEASIRSVYETLGEAVILVVLVVFLFLGSWRSTLIPIVTIPICVISVFAILYFMGFSINNMTLLALVLAIGLVVDDAIVMLENVHRHIEKGLSPIRAAFKGAGEIAFAIVAMTLTLVAVYAPIGFAEGLTGTVFREFAFTLAGAVLISGFVALTLSPMMCAHSLKSGEDNRYTRWLEGAMSSLQTGYMHLLARVIQRRWWVVGALCLVAVLGIYLFKSLPDELAPVEDSGTLVGFLRAPSDANANYVNQQMLSLESIWETIPEVNTYVAVSGIPSPNQGISFVALTPWEERDRSQADIVESVRGEASDIPGSIVNLVDMSPLPAAGFFPIEFVVQTTGTYEELNTLMQQLQADIYANNPNFIFLSSDLTIDSTQLNMVVDRDRIADLGIDMNQISDAVSILLSGRNITEFQPAGLSKNYDVRVELRDEDKRNQDQIQHIYVRTNTGNMVPLSSVVRFEEAVVPDALPHYDRLRSATLSAQLAPGYTQGQAVAYLQDLAARVLSDEQSYSWAGQTRDFLESSGTMFFTMLLALLFIFLVLSAQFESFRDPFVVMLTVPFAIIGALVALTLLNDGTRNLYTQIGFVTLIGLITKHGILITEFANQLQRQGQQKVEAVIAAAGTRLRPILMTTGAMVLGAVPLAIATGAGAHARSQLGWVIVGGMTIGTLFSLFVVPVAYTLLAKSKPGESEAMRILADQGGH